MMYSIAIIQDVHFKMFAELGKKGNKYTVSIGLENASDFKLKEFDDIESAYTVFEKISKAIVTGCYSYEQRKEFLN